MRGDALAHHHGLEQQREVARKAQPVGAHDAHEVGEKRTQAELLQRSVDVALDEAGEILFEFRPVGVLARDSESYSTVAVAA